MNKETNNFKKKFIKILVWKLKIWNNNYSFLRDIRIFAVFSARICQGAVPSVVLFEGNNAVVEVCSFRRNAAASSSNHLFAKIHWLVSETLFLSRTCGQEIGPGGAHTGFVISPGFGDRNYPDNVVDCDFNLNAPVGMVVRLHAHSFTLEAGDRNGRCAFDSLTVINLNFQLVQILTSYFVVPISHSSWKVHK